MAIGFKKSMFGFNRNDVLKYIDETHKSFNIQKSELEGRIASLNVAVESLREELKSTQDNLATVTLEKTQIESELKAYNEKYDEINRLSQSIGKLYLVAQANANSIMANSTQNMELAHQEIEENIESINDAHRSLIAAKARVLETSSQFASSIDGLLASLEETRAKLESNDQDSKEKLSGFEVLLSEHS